jgi:hypothetical protein
MYVKITILSMYLKTDIKVDIIYNCHLVSITVSG